MNTREDSEHKLFNVITIETHNLCTRKCWFCKFGQKRQDESNVQMEWEIIESIIFNLRDLDYKGRISWFWINEPLMEKRLPEILSFTKEQCPKAFLSLVTNGDLLDEDIYHTLRQNGLDALGVSIYDDKTFKKLSQFNDRRLVKMDMRSRKIGQLENRGGNIKWNKAQFDEYRRLHGYRTCNRPFTMMTVNPQGKVVLCCSDMYSDVVMGDVRQQRLQDIWNNEHFRHYRKSLKEKGRKGLKLCENCSHNGSSSPFFYPLRDNPRKKFVNRTGRAINRIIDTVIHIN